ncbi:MAG: response regulator [Campylobacterota bacterium]|nr:response regulator [Campylobacterota bacterium]
MKYLVIDDSKLARLSLIKSLKMNIVGDAEIFQAGNGAEAIDIVESEKPDIAFLDLTMPIMDGYEALPLMLEKHPHLKVIVVSADVQERAKLKVLKLGAQLHVKKPINNIKMQEILKNL